MYFQQLVSSFLGALLLSTICVSAQAQLMDIGINIRPDLGARNPNRDRVKNEARWQMPPGFQLIDIDLNKGAGGDFIYMNYFSGRIQAPYPPITDLHVITDREPLLPGWERIGANLNSNAGGERLYLVYRRGHGSPIQTLCVTQGQNPQMPPGWIKVPVDLNKGCRGSVDLFLWYRK